MNPGKSRIERCLALVVLCLSAASAAEPESIKLDYKEGYVVIDTDVRRTVADWRLEGKVSMGELPLGRNLRLMPMKAGSYQWTEISVPYYNLPHALDLSDDQRWSFKVERHKINYFGTLIVAEDRGSDSVDARLVNRAAQVIELLMEQYPEHLALYQLQYAGSKRDDFIDLVMTRHDASTHD